MERWIRFLIVLIFAAAAALFYGWRIDPAKDIYATPDALRIDYQADYVFMVAEVYQAEHDIDQAARRLAVLGDEPPAVIIGRIILGTGNLKDSDGRPLYAPQDLALMQSLADALANWQPAGGTP